MGDGSSGVYFSRADEKEGTWAGFTYSVVLIIKSRDIRIHWNNVYLFWDKF